MTFQEWMDEVDDKLYVRCGLESDDLPDACYYDSYIDGLELSNTTNLSVTSLLGEIVTPQRWKKCYNVV